MNRISASTRISLGLACLAISVLLAAELLNLFPTSSKHVLDNRKQLCETIAIHASIGIQKDDLAAVQAAIAATVARNDDLLSAGIRNGDGKLLVKTVGHAGAWEEMEDDQSDISQVQVAIFKADEKWGTLELRFRPISAGSGIPVLGHPMTRLALFIGGGCFLLFFKYLRKTLQHLDPSSVIPSRVRSTLDTLAEGVLVLDKKGRIVLANEAFAQATQLSASSLQGRKASSLNWMGRGVEDEDNEDAFPWLDVIKKGDTQMGVQLSLTTPEKTQHTFSVNSAPIIGNDGVKRGALATFNDITGIRKKNAQLQSTLAMLKGSRDEVDRQNRRLEFLATRDPLTGCLNRRSLFEAFENEMDRARRHNYPIACIMIDLDNFKSINDMHGHTTGDDVLQQIATILHATARKHDIVGRYGGEEFCILLPHVDMDGAYQAAERCRKSIEEKNSRGIEVTASFGVSASEYGATDMRDLLDEADQALYAAKRTGRNKTVRANDMPADIEPGGDRRAAGPTEDKGVNAVPIPLHVVTALLSVLDHRDMETGEHSKRVADLCVTVAAGWLSARESYALEVAALLHDIGKLGVPDSILLKPGRLTEQEWSVMNAHNRLGSEIVASAFSSPELTQIARSCHAWFGGSEREPGLPTGEDIPVASRILSIADAFDAMTADRPYRKARSYEAAFEELRRCAGTQFDPEVVERFIEAISRRQSESQSESAHSRTNNKVLQIGLQVERLACALDSQDIPTTAALAGRLAALAAKEGETQIAELARQIQRGASKGGDVIDMVKLTTELTELCRSTLQARSA